MADVTYPFDETGIAASNLVVDELYTITEVNARPYRVIVPTFAPFYLHNFVVEHVSSAGVVTPLVEGGDFYFALKYMAASRATGQPVYGGLQLLNPALAGTIRIRKYQTVGGPWVCDKDHVYQMLLEMGYNARTTWFDTITDVQEIFPPGEHAEDASQISGHNEILASLDGIADAILSKPQLDLLTQVTQIIARIRDDLIPVIEAGDLGVHSAVTSEMNAAFLTNNQQLTLAYQNADASLRATLNARIDAIIAGGGSGYVEADAALKTAITNETATKLSLLNQNLLGYIDGRDNSVLASLSQSIIDNDNAVKGALRQEIVAGDQAERAAMNAAIAGVNQSIASVVASLFTKAAADLLYEPLNSSNRGKWVEIFSTEEVAGWRENTMDLYTRFGRGQYRVVLRSHAGLDMSGYELSYIPPPYAGHGAGIYGDLSYAEPMLWRLYLNNSGMTFLRMAHIYVTGPAVNGESSFAGMALWDPLLADPNYVDATGMGASATGGNGAVAPGVQNVNRIAKLGLLYEWDGPYTVFKWQ